MKALKPVVAQDLRALTGLQPFAAQAPVNVAAGALLLLKARHFRYVFRELLVDQGWFDGFERLFPAAHTLQLLRLGDKLI